MVVAIGTAACGCCVRCGNGEAGDRLSLEPEGRQLELLAAVINATRTRKAHALVYQTWIEARRDTLFDVFADCAIRSLSSCLSR